ncbi:MAG: hypothetical protein CBC42_03440 [Betaproteobacteria bacterium TMED82]|nr:MAG: hypothetical protein CBC42_03440 [Betaproteobacteria bacterium TMED82]|tara:strand:+ start:73253 stop:73771 length:519 start_codon:yes stop_codon:yes gene_type:complete
MKRTLFTGITLVIFLFLGFLSNYYFFSGNSKNEDVSWILQEAFPNSELKSIKLSDLQGKRGTLINFWATWCAPCIDEMPMFSKIHGEFLREDFSVIGLAVDTNKNVLDFLEDRDLKQHILIVGSKGTEMLSKLGNETNSLPFTIFIDANGMMKEFKLGKMTEDEVKYWLVND